MNPRLSVEVYLNVDFDFNLTPLAPLGTLVLIFKDLIRDARLHSMAWKGGIGGQPRNTIDATPFMSQTYVRRGGFAVCFRYLLVLNIFCLAFIT